MAKQTINIGTAANDGTGDPLRTAFTKINANFTELYGGDDDATNFVIEDTSPQLGGNLDINGWNITSARSNESIRIIPNGTGSIALEGNTAVTGTLTVSTSLALASGATVTGILDEDNMGTNSATQLATQQSIKAYVDAQVTAQDLDFACDDSTTLSIDLDSESLQFSGGAGITTAGTGNTVTVAIDSTVTTLTGSQTLTNKTLTSPVLNTGVSGTAFKDEDNMASDSATALASQQSIKAYVDGKSHTALTGSTDNQITTVTGANAIQGEANLTFDGTTLTLTGTAALDGVTITDNTISTNASDANLEISANGTGAVDVKSAMTTIGQTVTGTVSVTGQLNADNIRIDGNVISATSGAITLTPAAGQNVTVSGTNTNFTAAEIHGTVGEFTTLRTDKLEVDTSDGDMSINTQGTGTLDFNTPTQTTIGSAGGASALPGAPTGYLKVKVAGTLRVIPFWDQA